MTRGGSPARSSRQRTSDSYGSWQAKALMATTRLGEKSAGRPLRERSSKPRRRSRKKRLRHLLTILARRIEAGCDLIVVEPAAAYSTILARTTSRYDDVYFRAVTSSRARQHPISRCDMGTFWAYTSLPGRQGAMVGGYMPDLYVIVFMELGT